MVWGPYTPAYSKKWLCLHPCAPPLSITSETFQVWIKHIGFTPLYLARANIACDVDENLRHDPDQRRDSEKFFFPHWFKLG